MKKSRQPLRVSFIYDDSLDGSEGVAQYVKTLGTWLSGRGHSVSYFVGETKIRSFGGSPVFSLAKNFKVTFNANKLSVPFPAKGSDIKAAIKDARPDVVHIQMPHSPLMAAKVINRLPATTARIGTFHIFPASKLVSIGSRLLRAAYLGNLSKIDKVVSVSPAAQSFAKSAFGLSTEVVPNMVDTSLFKTTTANIPGRIVFLGRLVPRKGAKQLIEAFALITSRFPEAELIIAGAGAQSDELKELCAKLGLEKKVQFPGFIKEEDKAPLLASAAVACFPSLYGESFGIVLIEAMAAGSGVVIGGNNPGYTTVLNDRPQLLIDPTHTAEFADRLATMLEEKAQAAAHHKWQTEEVGKYDVNVVGAKMESIYFEAIANRTIKRHN